MRKGIKFFIIFVSLILAVLPAFSYDSSDNQVIFSLGYFNSIPSTPAKPYFSEDIFGLHFSQETEGLNGIFNILAYEHISIHEYNITSLISFSLGRNYADFFQPYLGLGIGINYRGKNYWDFDSLAWKANAGLRFNFYDTIYTKLEASYVTVLGLTGMFSVGIAVPIDVLKK